MGMRFLDLPRLEAVQITEETTGLKKTGLDHFLWGKTPLLFQLCPVHGPP
jgi:hypothetical protein